jgi:uncharacterized protein (DUF1697 family)
MQTFISLLRGVNITGHNAIKMTDLAALYRNLGFLSTETYIQSGNVIFKSDTDSPVSDIALKIERAILHKFHFNLRVMIRTVSEMREIISSNPFLSEDRFDPSKMAVIFLHEKVSIAQIQKISDVDYPPDKFKIIGKEIFTFCPNGFGKTKLYTNYFEQKMGVTGTARNWKTITTISKIAENLE